MDHWRNATTEPEANGNTAEQHVKMMTMMMMMMMMMMDVAKGLQQCKHKRTLLKIATLMQVMINEDCLRKCAAGPNASQTWE